MFVEFIPDMGLPSWCTTREWLALVERDDGQGAFGRARERDDAVTKAFSLSRTWGPQQEEGSEPEQRRLFE